MRANQGKLNALGKSRAMEKQLQAPQLMDSNLLEPTTNAVIEGKGMSEDARMKRVVGGRKKKGSSNGVMMGGAESEAMSLGKKLAAQLKEKHGASFFDDFHKGLMYGGAGPISAPPPGVEVSHASLSPAKMGLAGQALGGQDVPPGGIAPKAYGSVPQAPASFERNTVGMGRRGKQTPKDKEDEKLGMEVAMLKKKVRGGQRPTEFATKEQMAAAIAGLPKPEPVKAPRKLIRTREIGGPTTVASPNSAFTTMKRPTTPTNQKVILMEPSTPKRRKGGMKCEECERGGAKKSSTRGQMISRLMKEKGMTLGQASKYLKDNS